MRLFHKVCLTSLTLVSLASCLCAEPNNLEWHGDVRLRNEGVYNANSANTVRERLRFRIGTEVPINAQFKAKFGFASGNDGGRSNEQTLGEVISTANRGPKQYDLRLNHAYIEYTPNADLTVTYGKSKNPVWTSSELLWDADINVDGVGVKYAPKNQTWFVNAAAIVFQELEKSSAAGVKAWFVQPGFTYDAGRSIHKVALGYYLFDNLQGSVVGNGSESSTSSGATNTLQGGVLRYKYNVITLTAESKFADFFNFPLLKVYAEGVYNPEPTDANHGVLFGFTFGDKKVQEIGQWQFDVNYRYLLADAWLDVLPDASFYNGRTSVKGLRASSSLALEKDTILTGTVYFTENIATKLSQTVAQIDLKVGF
jgi:hypothetical protein